MEFLKNVLGEDLYKQVADKLNGNKDIKLANLASGEYVSKQKYDDDLKERDTKIADLSKTVQNFDGVDVKKLQDDVKEWKTKYDSDIKAERRNSAIKLAVAKAGARSEKALMGMLDMDSIKLGDDGKITGLDEQIAQIKKDDAFLFKPDDDPGSGTKKDVNLGGEHKGTQKQEITTLADAVEDFYNK
mgnify:CR=1 FL=1